MQKKEGHRNFRARVHRQAVAAHQRYLRKSLEEPEGEKTPIWLEGQQAGLRRRDLYCKTMADGAAPSASAADAENEACRGHHRAAGVAQLVTTRELPPEEPGARQKRRKTKDKKRSR